MYGTDYTAICAFLEQILQTCLQQIWTDGNKPKHPQTDIISKEPMNERILLLLLSIQDAPLVAISHLIS